MKERPILFSAPMVRALLSDTKTQTRRIVKGAPDDWAPVGPETFSPTVTDRHGDEQPVPDSFGAGDADGDCWIRCPYGQPGDRLWVREAWDFIPEGDPGTPNCAGIRYWADAAYELCSPPSTFNPLMYGKEKVRPSIHMPRWASRITLEVTIVRVERLHDISRGDAMAEGCPFPNMAQGHDPRHWYAELWEQINGAGSWNANPWVWVIEFRRAGEAIARRATT